MPHVAPINVFEFDLVDTIDSVIPVNYSVADFRDLASRNGSYSKTIKIPGTKRNDNILSSAFDITAQGFFDRNLSNPSFVEIDGIRTFDGIMKLKKVIENNGKIVEYEIELLGNNASWFGDLSGKSIRDLGLGRHTFDTQTVQDSWAFNGDTSTYVYPLIDYGDLTDKQFVGPVEVGVSVLQFRPAVFIKPILKQIYNEIGYEVKLTFFKGFARDLIMPFTNDTIELPEDIAEENSTSVRRSADYIETAQAFTLDFDTIVSDVSNNFNLAGDFYTCPLTGTYGATVQIVFATSLNISLTSVKIILRLNFGSESVEVDLSVPKGRKIDGAILTANFINIKLNTGDTISATVIKEGQGINKLFINAATMEINPETLEFSLGAPIEVAETLKDIKQLDFIRSINQMFNLYMITDSERKIVEFIQRDEFFLDISQAVDWSDKLDISRQTEILQIDEDISRVLEFKYKDDDKDVFMADYNNTLKTKFGNDKEELANENLQGEQDVADLEFAGTLMGNQLGGTLFIPVLYADQTGIPTYDFEPRILIYEGLKAKDWKYNTGAAILDLESFPQAIFQPAESTAFDINLHFRNLNDLFPTPGQTFIGLKDRYYKAQIQQLNNGRLYKAFFKLDSLDISELDFRKPVLVDGVYYYINKVKDFLVGSNESTEVELIQKVS